MTNNQTMTHTIQEGFTLIEVLIVVAIVAILSAIAIPSYQDQVTRTSRADGKTYLLDLASAQEGFYAQNLSYANSMSQLSASANSPEGKYTVVVTTLPSGCAAGSTACRTFSFTATPTFSDSGCTTLTYNSSGTEGSTGSETSDECWR